MIEEIPLLRKNAVSHSLPGVVENMIRKGPVTPRSVPFVSRKTVKVPLKLSGFLTVSIHWATTPSLVDLISFFVPFYPFLLYGLNKCQES